MDRLAWKAKIGLVASHSATLWRALALAGIETPIPGYGRLLAEP
jgi:maleate cis-trans isomerase